MHESVEALYRAMGEAVLNGSDFEAADLARRAVELDLPALDVLDRGFIPGIRKAGDLWESGDYFLPELVGSAQAMSAAMKELRGRLSGVAQVATVGRVLIGTVEGDIHDIGKTLVAALMGAHGFSVFDEGVDVPIERFVARAREVNAEIICASALLTTTMSAQRKLVAAVREAGLPTKVMVGGAPVNRQWADEIGAHGYADSAVTAVTEARRLLGGG